MEAHVMKLENNCVIVDEEYFNEIKKKAESNQERINEIAEEKFFGIRQRKRYQTFLRSERNTLYISL